MGARAEEAAARSERARAIGLFRYGLIREAADPGAVDPGPGPAGAGGRRGRAHSTRPGGGCGSRATRWTGGSGRGGAAGSTRWCPARASARRGCRSRWSRWRSRSSGRTPTAPAAQVARILRTQMGWAPGERTLQRWFADDPQHRRPDAAARGAAGPVFGRFEAAAPERVVDRGRPARPARRRPQDLPVRLPRRPLPGDHGAPVRVRRGHRAAGGRAAPGARARAGSPTGSTSTTARRSSTPGCCAPARSSGIRLIHSTPGRPQGRGKIERYFRTVREQFLVEITGDPDADPSRHPVADLGELNRLFTAWVETVYHRQIHSETGQAPLAPLARRRPVPDPEHRRAGRGVPLGGTAHRHQDRAGVAAGQHLPGRPAAGRAPGRAGVRPVRPHPHPGPAPRRPGRHRDPAPDRPPRPPQGPTRDPTRAAGTDRDRLRPPASPTSTTPSSATPSPASTTPPSPAALPAGSTDQLPDQQRTTSSPDSSTCSPTRGDTDLTRRRGGVVIDRLQGFFGFTRTPFGRDLAPGDAAPPRRPRRGRRPDRLVHHRTPHRGDHRRGRRREDRRRPRRARRPGPHPAHHHLPAQPHGRGPRHPPPDRRRPRAAAR